MLRVILTALLVGLVASPAYPAAVIFSGSNVKALKQNLDLNGSVSVLSGTADPMTTATSAPAGSMYLNTSNGYSYRKIDAGSSTNWRRQGETMFDFSQNLLKNPGFETGIATWTASGGTWAQTTTASKVGSGIAAGSWDSNGAGQTLKSGVALPQGLVGHNCVASANIQVPAGTATHTLALTDGTNILASATVTSGANYTRTSVNAPCPASGSSIEFRLTSVSSNEPEIEIDDVFLGDATFLNIGSGPIAADWLSDLTFTTDNFGTLASNQFKYKRVGDTMFVSGTFTAGTTVAATAAIDLPTGLTIDTSKMTTDTHGQVTGFAVSNILGSVNIYAATVGQVLFFDGSTNNKVFFASAETAASGFTKANGNSVANSSGIVTFQFQVPITQWATTGTYFRADQTANSWSGYHDNTCSWTRTNTAFGDPTADASCALVERVNKNFGTVSTSGSVLPAITFTPSKIGSYYVCAHTNLTTTAGGAGTGLAAQLWDGTTKIAEREASVAANNQELPVSLCGIYNATSTSAVTLSIRSLAQFSDVVIGSAKAESVSSIEWSIIQITANTPAPYLVNSVVTQSSGVEGMNRAKIVCSSSSSITSQSGSWISSVGNVSSGACNVIIASGVYSATPTCTASTDVNTSLELDVSNVLTVSSTNIVVTNRWMASGSATLHDATTFTVDVLCQAAH